MKADTATARNILELMHKLATELTDAEIADIANVLNHAIDRLIKEQGEEGLK